MRQSQGSQNNLALLRAISTRSLYQIYESRLNPTGSQLFEPPEQFWEAVVRNLLELTGLFLFQRVVIFFVVVEVIE